MGWENQFGNLLALLCLARSLVEISIHYQNSNIELQKAQEITRSQADSLTRKNEAYKITIERAETAENKIQELQGGLKQYRLQPFSTTFYTFFLLPPLTILKNKISTVTILFHEYVRHKHFIPYHLCAFEFEIFF